MVKHFSIQIDDDYGSLGFIEKGAPEEFTPLAGMGTAHDCLEHFPGDNGSCDHEFLALGAMTWIRGEQGYFPNDTANSIGVEISMTIWRAYHYDDCPMKKVKPNNRLEIDSVFYRATREARKEIIHDFDTLYEKKLQHFLSCAEYWLQVGFNRAKQRYREPWKVISVFKMIEEQVNNALLDDCYPGEEYEIHYCISKVTATVIKIEEEYEY